MKQITLSENNQPIASYLGSQSQSYQTHSIRQKKDISDKANIGMIPQKLAHPRRNLGIQTTLYSAGRQANTLYIVNQGMLKAIIPTAMGKNRIADIYGAGDLLGSAAINGAKHVETVVAIEDCIVTPIDPYQCMADNAFSKYLVNTLAKQMRRHREFIDDAELPVGARLTRTLGRLALRFGTKQEKNGLVHLSTTLTHSEFAELTGSSRVTMTRIFGELKNAKALYGHRGDYLVDLNLLEDATDDYVMEVI